MPPTSPQLRTDCPDFLPEDVRDRVAVVDVSDDRQAAYDASVVVVTYGCEAAELTATLDALDDQDAHDDQDAPSFEVLLIDNGTEWDLHGVQAEYDVVTVYVAFLENYGVNVARNTGANVANGDLLVFLDDDAVPAPDFVSQHLRAHEEHDIVAARGRVYPKSKSMFTGMAPRYDLGDEPMPYPLDVEGNLSIDRDAFTAVGGFEEDVFGHEGLELTVRLLDRWDHRATIYYPAAVVYHDFVNGFLELVEKKARHGYYKQHLRKQRPELFGVYQRYDYEHQAENETPLGQLVVLYLISRLSNWLARLVRARRSFDRPTR